MGSVRTNVVLDEDLVAKVMRLYRLRTKRAAVDFALRLAAGEDDRRRMLDMRGTGWEGDLATLRTGRPNPS